jgi:hypothetical protein
MWEYLEKSGIDLNNEAMVAKAKKAYRKQYKREHTRQRRKSHPEVTLRFNLQEWLSLQRLAKEYDKPIATTVKLCYLAFRQGKAQLPQTKSTAPVQQALRIIQSDLIMLNKHLNRLEHHELARVVVALGKRYQQLEERFKLFMETPRKHQ